MRSSDTKRIEDTLHQIDDVWSKVRPGKRMMGNDREGDFIVIPLEDLHAIIGNFESEAEAKAFAEAPEHVDTLVALVRGLLRDREDAYEALQEISDKVDPAHEDFECQRPVDMRGVLSTSRRWCKHILDDSNVVT